MWKFNKDNWVYIAEPNIEMFLLEQHNNQLGDEKSVELPVKISKKRSKKDKTTIQT